ncbi:MAG: Phenylalanine-tRNA ligase alpha subunit [Candidatus Kaiserbacteria bacterium GW2011_GWA2_49_19]|uniref:phenylalanine--tRNA ligase n=1 Tax=Candidatus Kaiserbacteria bacterium GW2011_GWA2_49_19 TaxID=1618669 RepID=A0A0G1VSK9_9BACT|nr:MAG: Phenylalanine-tRNA ligase alpha subunit [Candidatus Kaiserbacteria bacterium GW2011_GWA2_49_19]
MNPLVVSKVLGHIHPISRAVFDIRRIFEDLGFAVAVGPELETEHYNFDVLNFPKDHPARDMQDSFWLRSQNATNADFTQTNAEGGIQRESASSQRPSVRSLLRTHTSPVQVRYMEEKLKAGIMPPYKIVVPGKAFRNEATDATHEAQFFHVECLYVDKNVSMAQLKGTLIYFFKKFFGEDVEVRFRVSFFPFTEPSAEIDMKLKGKWLEMGGSGLVHPNVLKAAGVPEGYGGFAFGVGIDRLVMLKYGIPDIRMFYNGDLRLVNQF